MDNETNKKDKKVHFETLPTDLPYAILRKGYEDNLLKLAQNRTDEINFTGIIISAKEFENGKVLTNSFAFGSNQDIIGALMIFLAKNIKEYITKNENETLSKQEMLDFFINRFFESIKSEYSEEHDDETYIDYEG